MYKILGFLVLALAFKTSIGQTDTLKNKIILGSEFSLGGAYQSGGLDLFTLKSTLLANVDYNKINSNTFLQYGFNKTFANVIKNDFFGYDIISIGKEKRLHPKFAGMYENSKIRSIENYYVVGAGIGWNTITKANYKLVIMNTISFEKKEFIINKSLNYEGFRYSIIVKGEYDLFKKKLVVKHNFFINPILFQSETNYRYRFLVDLLMPITKKLRANVSYNYSNENIVDTGFYPENTLLTFGLSIKL